MEGASRCKVDKRKRTADAVKRIRTEVPPRERQGRRYRRGGDRDRSIVGAARPTRTAIERARGEEGRL